MSLISDALKKVQKEREERTTPDPPSQSSSSPSPDSPGGRSGIPGLFLWIPAGFLFLAGFILLILPSPQNMSNQSLEPAATKPTLPSPATVTSETHSESLSKGNPSGKNRGKTTEPPVHSPSPGPSKKPVSDSVDSSSPKPARSSGQARPSSSRTTPSSSPPPEGQRDLYSRANAHLTASRPGEAARLFKELLKKEKKASTYLHLYRCYRQLNRPVMTRFYIQEGLKHFPRHFLLRKTAAILRIRSREYPEARRHIVAALEKKKDDYSLYTYLGLCNFHSRRYEAALENFRHSLNLNSQAIENHYYIGLIHDNRQEYSRALESYGYFIRLNRDKQSYRHREWVLQRVRLLRGLLNH